MSDAVVYWKWLSKVLGAAAQNTDAVLEHIEWTPQRAFEQAEGLFEQQIITKAQYAHSKTITLQEIEDELKREEQFGVKVIGLSDEDYPPLLKNISAPPLALHVKGGIHHMHSAVCISVVGTRRPSAYGSEAIDFISAKLAEAGVIVISGLAAGLDSVAHKAAITRDLPTVAVVGGGLDVYYPKANKKLQQLIEKLGAVVSEYSLGTPPERHHFLQRNRIIAGLAHGLCVAEARKYSGTMSTVRYALEAGRDVFAVPGSIFSPLSEGTNVLIKEGAYCVTRAEDILATYGIKAQECAEKTENNLQNSQLQISQAAKQVYQYISREEKSLEEICKLSAFTTGEVLAALSELELEGLVRKVPGQRYTLNI